MGAKIATPSTTITDDNQFLVSFLVDTRGGAKRGCRHTGVRVIIPSKAVFQPTRITLRYVDFQPNSPRLADGEAFVSRIIEFGPIAAQFKRPVILEVPHFASLRGKEREIVILRSDNGETWHEHTLVHIDETIQHSLKTSFGNDELYQIGDFDKNHITRIVTNDCPSFFAIVSRIHKQTKKIGPEGGVLTSAELRVQVEFPENALVRPIKVGLQALPIDSNITSKLLGHGVAASPIVTIEPRRRKLHRSVKITMPTPKPLTEDVLTQYSSMSDETSPLRFLCSIMSGESHAVWEDVTGTIPLTFNEDSSISFSSLVTAKFWLLDCSNILEVSKLATDLYAYNVQVPFMAKFVVFAKRIYVNEAKLSIFCTVDDKEDELLEKENHFREVGRSNDVEILAGKTIHLEFAGNLVPIAESQFNFQFNAFKTNRVTFTVRIRHQDDPNGSVLFMNESRDDVDSSAQTPICSVNISLPKTVFGDD